MRKMIWINLVNSSNLLSYSSHDTKLTLYKTNQNKLWGLISNKIIIEWQN